MRHVAADESLVANVAITLLCHSGNEFNQAAIPNDNGGSPRRARAKPATAN